MVHLPKSGLQPPVISSQSYGWRNVLVEEFHQPPGQERYQTLTNHTLCLSLNHRPTRLFHTLGDRRYTSLFAKGDLTVTPAGWAMSTHWSEHDQYLRIRIASEFLRHVAAEAMQSPSAAEGIALDPDQIEVLPEFRVRSQPIEQISMMLLNELHTGGLGGTLYVESLTTALAVHLLRSHSSSQSCGALVERELRYEGGLSDRQLLNVTDYIHAHLADNIQLSDLAALVDLSQFHFSRLFKQSTGAAPHQYLLQQRIERAKQLLKATDLPIMDIALSCGFSSHSHLGKWIQRYTGLSPKAYRAI